MTLYEKLKMLLDIAGYQLEEWLDGKERVKTKDFSAVMSYDLITVWDDKEGDKFCTLDELNEILDSIHMCIQGIGKDDYYLTYEFRGIKNATI